MIAEIIITSFFCLFWGLIIYARWNYGVLETLGIPVIKPTFFLGSVPDCHTKIQHLEDCERFKKYGGIYGLYSGRTPQIHISDPELIRMIFVKDYESFSTRIEGHMGDPVLDELMDRLPEERWKVVRPIATRGFTTAHIKVMSEVCREYSEELITDLKEESMEGRMKVDIRRKLLIMMMTVILKCSLGIVVDNRKDIENVFTHMGRHILGEFADFNLVYSLSLVFPFLLKFAPPFPFQKVDVYKSAFRGVVERRRKIGVQQNDFVDIYISMLDKLETPEFKEAGVTEDTVTAVALLFLLAGFDSVATITTMLIYNLAQNTEIQDKLRAEIDDAYEHRGGKFDYQSLMDLPYLTGCVNEAVRLYPPFFRPERMCTKDWEYKGIKIKKGMQVVLSTWAANRSPELFSDPDTFDPERWNPENKDIHSSYAITTFGIGPKNCPGARLSQVFVKIAICHLLRSYLVEARSDTKINYRIGSPFMVFYDPINVDLVERSL